MEEILLLTHFLIGIVGVFLSLALLGTLSVQNLDIGVLFELAVRFITVLQLLAWVFSISVTFSVNAGWVMLKPHVKFHWYTWMLSAFILMLLTVFTVDITNAAFFLMLVLLAMNIGQLALAAYAQDNDLAAPEESAVPLTWRQRYILFVYVSLLPVFTELSVTGGILLLVIQLWGVIGFGLSWHLRFVTQNSHVYNRRFAWVLLGDSIVTVILQSINVVLLLALTNGLRSVRALVIFFWFVGIAAGYLKATTAFILYSHVKKLASNAHVKQH